MKIQRIQLMQQICLSAVGQPIGSEAEGYEEILSGVTAVDAGKGEELKKFLDTVDERGGSIAKKPKGFLSCLGRNLEGPVVQT